MESVVGPLLVEEPLEVAATAGGESLEKERERERGVWVKRAQFYLCTYHLSSADLLTLEGGRNTPCPGLQLKYLTPE